MSYIGGKAQSGTYQTIINQVPPHRVYIEPFLGMGAILRYKKPASCSIAMDRDESVILHWLNQQESCSSRSQIPGVTFICGDAISYLGSNTFTKDTYIYLDPPYLLETRKYRQYYLWEMTNEQHEQLLQIILTLPCMVSLSGYWSELYSWYLQDWRFIQYQTKTRKNTPVTETLWMNYPDPIALHDYRYLGANYRQRERITRKIKRWQNKLTHMPRLERQALLAALEKTSHVSIATASDAVTATDGGTTITGEPAVTAPSQPAILAITATSDVPAWSTIYINDDARSELTSLKSVQSDPKIRCQATPILSDAGSNILV
ncbi:MAG: hypothetical protein A2W35_08095 [Chloroflexi bacterium RBG_16_57_11]|nr:MAG: hypothetical protein A2W35_08095 [Chloroflexi bacterium RBG_16_57_11]